MFDYSNFGDVFPANWQSPYDRGALTEIESSRRTLDGVLFIDRVLKALGITKAKIYPPKSDDALRQLHQQIRDAPMSLQHKLSLFYYLLLDFDHACGRAGPSTEFAIASGMPNNYQIFMRGLWYLDRLDLPKAIEYLAHPSLIADFADDIIIALVRHAPKRDYSLALSYFYTVQPILKSSTALELLFGAMARTNVSEALLFSRTHAPHAREQLFRQLLASILESERAGHSGDRTGDLAFLPLESIEEGWFEDYLVNGEGRSAKRAKETLLMRKIACDQFGDIAKSRISGGQWAPVLEGIRRGIDGHAD